MKRKYTKPTSLTVIIATRLLLIASQDGETSSEHVYNNPQDVGSALIKEQSSGSIWDDEW